MSTPGLISREFYTQDGAEYIREEWDLTVPGCPMIAIDHSKWGSGESIRNPHIVYARRTVKLRNGPPPH
jgi:hypothetical protein